MFEKFIVTNHITKRYFERIGANKKEVYRRIQRDLHFSKVKRIVNIGNHRHIFTLHSKEFIFKKDGPNWILKTIIKRSRNDNDYAIQKRLKSEQTA